jgi:CRP-like cAMP-binding protein
MGGKHHRFLTKLERGGELTPADRKALLDLCSPARSLPARTDLATEGDPLNSLFLILDGWVCRYRMLANGNRQIIALLLPGDLSQPFGAIPQTLSHSLMTLSAVSVCEISPRALRALTRTNPRVEDALWFDLHLERDLASELVVSLGRRSATERLACFFCEIYYRLAAVQLIEQPIFEIPLIQTELADLLGLSAVHVNRSLKELRRRELLTWRGRHFEILRPTELQDLAQFKPSYSLPQLTTPAEMAHG